MNPPPAHDLAVADAPAAEPRSIAPTADRRTIGPAPDLPADNAEAAPAPPSAPPAKIALDSPERFINRELSWLDFNHRVLEEAENPRHPLLERLRFVSISASNLDEFYSVRVAGLIGQAKAGVTTPSPDGRTPGPAACRDRGARRARCWPSSSASGASCAALLREAGIEVCEPPSSVATTTVTWLDAWFMERVFPVLTPLAIDPAHPFPFIPNMGLVMALLLAARRGRPRACAR